MLVDNHHTVNVKSNFSNSNLSHNIKNVNIKDKHKKLFSPEKQALHGHIYKTISTSLGLGALSFEAGELLAHNTVMGLPVNPQEKGLVLTGMFIGGLATYWSLANSIHFFKGKKQKNKTLLEATKYFYKTETLDEAKELLNTMSEPTKQILIAKYHEKIAQDHAKNIINHTHKRAEQKKARMNAAI